MSDHEYRPCAVGVHVCGQIEDEDGPRPLTLANFPMRSPAAARQAWAAAKAELEDAAGELMVDLNTAPHEQEDEFSMRRQMLPRLTAMMQAHPDAR